MSIHINYKNSAANITIEKDGHKVACTEEELFEWLSSSAIISEKVKPEAPMLHEYARAWVFVLRLNKLWENEVSDSGKPFREEKLRALAMAYPCAERLNANDSEKDVNKLFDRTSTSEIVALKKVLEYEEYCSSQTSHAQECFEYLSVHEIEKHLWRAMVHLRQK